MLMTIHRLYRLTAALLVALSLLLPLQVAWGAAAAYCEHETTTQGAKHFGHHQHEHKADVHDAEAKKPMVKKLVSTTTEPLVTSAARPHPSNQKVPRALHADVEADQQD